MKDERRLFVVERKDREREAIELLREYGEILLGKKKRRVSIDEEEVMWRIEEVAKEFARSKLVIFE